MVKAKRALKTEPVHIKEEEPMSFEIGCQTEEWEEERMKKYRKMKRKLVEMIAKKKEYQVMLDKANRKIKTLERKNRIQSKRVNTKKGDDLDTSALDEDLDDLDGILDNEEQEGEGEEEEEDDEEEEVDQLDEDDDTTPVAKKQRLSRRKRILIPRDENENIILPFQIASLNVIALGRIEYSRPHFHNERYIFPIGYTVERTFMSMVDPNNQTTYTCKVEDGQDGPLFTLSAADAPEIELSARTATGVWASVIKKANEARQKESSNAISGPEYYGFAHPLVIEMIEEMEGVDECSRYKRKHKY